MRKARENMRLDLYMKSATAAVQDMIMFSQVGCEDEMKILNGPR